ncbi:hypothetical protein ACP0SG_07610 [Campylobacter lari]|uniref:hypothetical protein n=1 Tax=Campylobacter lari TaxID=201 RepID=UPI003DA0C961|nr:YdeI/OmpD-associated family protein [Campylobacter lari]
MRLDVEFNGNITDDIEPSDFEEFDVEDVVWFYEALSKDEQNEFLYQIKKEEEPIDRIKELFEMLNNNEAIELLNELNSNFKSDKEWQEIVKNINNNIIERENDNKTNEIFHKGNFVVWLFGSDYSVYEVIKDYEESYVISDLIGRQIEIDPHKAEKGGYKDSKDDLFLWYFEVLDKNEVKIYPKKLTYNQMVEECKKYDMHLIKPLYSLGYTLNCNKEDFKD